MSGMEKAFIVEGEASESDEDDVPYTRDQTQGAEPSFEKSNASKFSKLTQMGFSVGNAVTSAVEKQLSVYLPSAKDDHSKQLGHPAPTKQDHFNIENKEENASAQPSSVHSSFFTKASSIAAEILPHQLNPKVMHEPGPEKSLLHEKLFEKNASLAKGFANWVDDNYNKKIPKILEELLHHLGTTTQVEFQESALSMQQAIQTSIYLMSALDETKLLADTIVFPDP